MEIRAGIFTILAIGILAAFLVYGLRPFWTRILRYWSALKQQDEEAQRDARQNAKLRAEAEQELKSGVIADVPEHLENKEKN